VPPDRIALGDFSQIDEGVHVFAGEGVRIGRHVHLAFGSCIAGGGACEIGDYAGISTGVRIITGSEEIQGGLTNPTIPADLRQVKRSRVVIGQHVLLFAGVTVLPGVTIGDGAVVAAGAVVHRNLEGWRVYAGSPLVCVGVRDADPILAKAAELEERERGVNAGVRQKSSLE
jgi:galactoside O-acetyltransferase